MERDHLTYEEFEALQRNFGDYLHPFAVCLEMPGLQHISFVYFIIICLAIPWQECLVMLAVMPEQFTLMIQSMIYIVISWYTVLTMRAMRSHADILCGLITSIRRQAARLHATQYLNSNTLLRMCQFGDLLFDRRSAGQSSGKRAVCQPLTEHFVSWNFLFPDGLPFFLRGLWWLWLRKLFFLMCSIWALSYCTCSP